jgi:hypothetical protein
LADVAEKREDSGFQSSTNHFAAADCRREDTTNGCFRADGANRL